MPNTDNFTYSTTEPSFFQKVKGLYWFTPKSRRLKKIRFENGIFFISVMSGQEISAPIEECAFKYGIDKADRMEAYISVQANKIHFTEITGMLEENDWEHIRSFIIDDCEAKEVASAKVLSAVEMVKDIVEDPVGSITGLAIDLFSNSGSIKKKIIAAICIILLVVGCIFYFTQKDAEENESLSCSLVSEILQENGDEDRCEKVELGESIQDGDSTIYPKAKAFLNNNQEIDIVVTVYEGQVIVNIPYEEDE